MVDIHQPVWFIQLHQAPMEKNGDDVNRVFHHTYF
jgi:hypothetical protein